MVIVCLVQRAVQSAALPLSTATVQALSLTQLVGLGQTSAVLVALGSHVSPSAAWTTPSPQLALQSASV
jgi:hypothetical protein